MRPVGLCSVVIAAAMALVVPFLRAAEAGGGTVDVTPAMPDIAGPAAVVGLAVRGAATQVGPPLALPRGPIYVDNGDITKRRIALTFDAGSDRGNAGPILDLLKAERLTVTFGITGHWADENPDLTKRMVDEGHTLINHTYTHGSLTGFATKKPPMTADQIRSELDRTEAAVRRVSGGSTKPWFRPPFIDMDASSMAVVAAAGYPFIAMHTVDSLGWQGLAPERLVARCLDKASPGGIYIFHVGEQSTDYVALPRLIAGLRSAGYEITSLPGVLAP